MSTLQIISYLVCQKPTKSDSDNQQCNINNNNNNNIYIYIYIYIISIVNVPFYIRQIVFFDFFDSSNGFLSMPDDCRNKTT